MHHLPHSIEGVQLRKQCRIGPDYFLCFIETNDLKAFISRTSHGKIPLHDESLNGLMHTLLVVTMMAVLSKVKIAFSLNGCATHITDVVCAIFFGQFSLV